MSTSGQPGPYNPPPPSMIPPPPMQRPAGNQALGCAFAVSLLLNLAAVLILVVGCLGLFFRVGGVSSEDNGSILGSLTEKYHSGKTSSKDKIAIVSLEGLIMEGALAFVHKEIEQAAKDGRVKAVVFRINSPGGSITASEDLHHRLIELRDGNKEKKYDPKPLVVSMASMAASGGYYVAMPGKKLFAERTTMTGSIGVYAALFNVHELAEKHGVTMNLIKAGKIKDSGSPFKELTGEERRVWQDMINTAYGQFLSVVQDGRPELTRQKMLQRFEVQPVIIDPALEQEAGGKPAPAPYKRYRADGGIFTADEALKLNLIDAIGPLDDAIAEARKLANVGDARAVQYEKPQGLRELLFGIRSNPPGLVLDPARLRNALMPRLWYLAPGFDLAGLLATMETN